MKVFLAPPGDPEPNLESDAIASINLAEGGIYFCLYPHLLRIRDETGQGHHLTIGLRWTQAPLTRNVIF